MTPTIITMNCNARGCPDGFTVVNYEKGRSYTLHDEIDTRTAQEFVSRGSASISQQPTLEETMADLMAFLKTQGVMIIQLTNEASAELLGLNPALYGDEMTALGREFDNARDALQKIDDESPEYDAAFKRYVAAYRAWDEAYKRLS